MSNAKKTMAIFAKNIQIILYFLQLYAIVQV